ncbi:uncharacterized protein Tco025E_09722, partial [Trypanosoma conorhini]
LFCPPPPLLPPPSRPNECRRPAAAASTGPLQPARDEGEVVRPQSRRVSSAFPASQPPRSRLRNRNPARPSVGTGADPQPPVASSRTAPRARLRFFAVPPQRKGGKRVRRRGSVAPHPPPAQFTRCATAAHGA